MHMNPESGSKVQRDRQAKASTTRSKILGLVSGLTRAVQMNKAVNVHIAYKIYMFCMKVLDCNVHLYTFFFQCIYYSYAVCFATVYNVSRHFRIKCGFQIDACTPGLHEIYLLQLL